MMSLTFGLFTQVRGSGPLGPLVSSPEPKAQGELLPSANVRRPSCVVCRQQLLQTTSPLKPLGLGS